MGHPVTGIDHCYLMVRDLDRSREQFRRLGFTLSPRGLHSAAKGSANHTIMLSRHDYFELLGLVAETADNRGRREALERDGEGLYAIACRIADAERAKAELARLGIATGDVGHFSRPVRLADGSESPASFSTLNFTDEEVPVGLAFMCQHHTPDLVWQPQLMRHANTAVALNGAVAACDDPESAARGYARLFAAGTVARADGGWQVRTGSIPLSFVTPAALRERYGALDLSSLPRPAFAVLRITVADLSAAEAILAANGVRTQATPRGIAVAPADASGAIVEFGVER